MPRRRNPYRPGSPSYARLREADLKRKAALARATASRAKSPETRQSANRRVSAALRALQVVESRTEYRAKLNEHERQVFDQLTVATQQQLVEVRREYPDSVPRDLPDPFTGPK